MELEGLCDRVIVMSRGQAVATLEGDEVTEERIVHAAISATTHTAEQAARRRRGSSRLAPLHRGRLRARSSSSPSVMLALGAYVWSQNGRYLSDFNITSVMFACAALGFISLGQTFALLLGGIDLSVGPARRLPRRARVVLHPRRASRPAIWVLGFVLMLVCAVARRARERRADPLREVHAGRGDARHVHRARRPRLHAARRARRLHRRLGDERHLDEGRARCRSPSSSSSLRALASSSALRKTRFGLRLRAVGLGRGVGAPRRRARQPDGAARLRRRLAAHASSARSSCSRSSASATRARAPATR